MMKKIMMTNFFDHTGFNAFDDDITMEELKGEAEKDDPTDDLG